MAHMRHIPPVSQPPPDLPHMPEAGVALTSYLRNFALWAKNSAANKVDAKTAQPGILLHANDAPAGGPAQSGSSYSGQDRRDTNRSAGRYWGWGDMTSHIKPGLGMPVEHVPEAPMDGRAYVRVNGEWAAIVEDIVHGVRVWAAVADCSMGRSSTAVCCCSTRWASSTEA